MMGLFKFQNKISAGLMLKEYLSSDTTSDPPWFSSHYTFIMALPLGKVVF
jgi:hypothetical protein